MAELNENTTAAGKPDVSTIGDVEADCYRRGYDEAFGRYVAVSTHCVELDREKALLQQELAQSRQQYLEIVGSRFWRMTSPFRHLLDRLRGFPPIRHLLTFLRLIRSEGFSAAWRQGKDYLRSPGTSEPEGGAASPFRGDLTAFFEDVLHRGGEIEGEVPVSCPGRKILFLSHELTLTGAPVALMEFAAAVRETGDTPVFLSPCPGPLSRDVAEKGIPTAICGDVYSGTLLPEHAGDFDLIVVNTAVGAPAVELLRESDTPVLWWIHEAALIYDDDTIRRTAPQFAPPNTSVFCVGSLAEKNWKDFRPFIPAENLYYYTPEAETAGELYPLPEAADGKTVFLLVGTQEYRKGQDVLCRAVRLLPAEIREGCYFVFVCRPNYLPFGYMIEALKEAYPDSVCQIDVLPRKELSTLYNRTDCLICASRDDPMPCTITEFLQLSKSVICSENTGYAPLLTQEGSGLVYRNNNAAELAECIIRMTDGVERRKSERAARQTYEKHFSRQAFFPQAEAAIEKTVRHRNEPFAPCVSVIIPTLNGAQELPPLLKSLSEQENVGQVETIVVDSGSTDGTPELAEEYGSVIVRIAPEDFSHSRARNLGASLAHGDYLLFMTQDALPESRSFLADMVSALEKQDSAAASCRQVPREGCDLFGRAALWSHMVTMGFDRGDTALFIRGDEDPAELRRIAQLDDVACMVRRCVFEKYRYRGKYAEDLDLGLRLARDGFRLSRLNSVRIIHSHSRSAYYHLRRAAVDTSTIRSILPGFPVDELTAQTAADRIVTGFCLTDAMIRTLRSRLSLPGSYEDLLKAAERAAAAALDALGDPSADARRLLSAGGHPDGDVSALTETLLKHFDTIRKDTGLFDYVLPYLSGSVIPLLKAEHAVLSPATAEEIFDALYKYFAQMTGSTLVGCILCGEREDPFLDELSCSLTAGI